MNTGLPLISVVMAARNESAHIDEALISILSQSYENIELIFVDDGSTDNTYNLVEQIALVDKRVRLNKNVGVGKVSAFNYGIQISRGEYLCLFAGDDIMPAESLMKRWCFLSDKASENSPVVGLSKLVTMCEDPVKDKVVLPRRSGVSSLSGVSPLMSRSAASLIFPVPTSLPNEDTWMELAIIHLSDLKVFHGDIISCQWRIHAGNSVPANLSYVEFNRRFSARMEAIYLFLSSNSNKISDFNVDVLIGKCECEDARRLGSISGVLLSNVNLMYKLRMLLLTSKYLYALKSKLHILLSGWSGR